MTDLQLMDREIEQMLNEMSEHQDVPTDNVVTIGEGTVKLSAHMRGTNLFIPNITNIRHEGDVLDSIGMGPIWMALSGGGTYHLGGIEIVVPAVDLKDLSVVSVTLTLTDRLFEDQRFVKVGLGNLTNDEVKALRRKANTEEVKVGGLALRLPPWMIRLQTAHEASICGIPYNWDSFKRGYRKDLAGAMNGVIETTVLTTPRQALQAHAAFDPRIGPDEVGISRGDARRLMLRLKHTGLDGRRVILGRFPAAGEKSFRFVTLVILDDQEDGMIYLDAEAWRDLHGGDFDGDLGYILIDGFDLFCCPLHREYPEMAILDGSGVIDTLGANRTVLDADKAVSLIMGALIKKLTGSLTVTFHVLARSAAVRYASNPAYPGTENERMKKAYRGVFTVFFPILEAVMDARKDQGHEAELRRVALALQHVMNGGVLDTEAFEFFLG